MIERQCSVEHIVGIEVESVAKAAIGLHPAAIVKYGSFWQAGSARGVDVKQAIGAEVFLCGWRIVVGAIGNFFSQAAPAFRRTAGFFQCWRIS